MTRIVYSCDNCKKEVDNLYTMFEPFKHIVMVGKVDYIQKEICKECRQKLVEKVTGLVVDFWENENF